MPVVLLTDGNLANGSEPWRIVDINELPPINPPIVTRKTLEEQKRWENCFSERGLFNPYTIDNRSIRPWAIPGEEGLEHRIGGLEKRVVTGEISYAADDHEAMNELRRERVEMAQADIAAPKAVGAKEGLLIVGWGSTYGILSEVVEELFVSGHKIAHCHLDMLNPISERLDQILPEYDRVLVCEQNCGQLVQHLNDIFRNCEIDAYLSYNTESFSAEELREEFLFNLDELEVMRQNFDALTNGINIYDKKDELLS